MPNFAYVAKVVEGEEEERRLFDKNKTARADVISKIS